MNTIRVLSVASEAYPLVKTGGLADVIGALPAALAAENVQVRTLIPGYHAVLHAAAAATPRELPLPTGVTDQAGGPGRLLAVTLKGLEFLVLDIPHLFDRPGNPYVGSDGLDWSDNALRFATLARTAAGIGRDGVEDWLPDVVHAHDWQAGLTPAYLHYQDGRRPGTVMTVHNLAFAGKVPLSMRTRLHLPEAAIQLDGVEFYGTISMLKAGLQFADRVTTVSPTYADEILTPEGGMGFDGVLRARGAAVSGILNGIDTEAWNPETDTLLAAPYSRATRKARAANKAALQQRMGLAVDPNALVFGVVSRLSWQKGLDMLLDALPVLLGTGAQLAVLGAGDALIETGFREAALANPGRVGCIIGYKEPLAHGIQAGVDALLVPSRFEPCGLTQLCALRYGAVPVVARVGGLADTVIDANPMALSAGVATGLQFAPVSEDRLEAAILHAAALFADKPVWAKIQANGMAADVSWRGPARRYAQLYRGLVRGA
jgi:starch synthase